MRLNNIHFHIKAVDLPAELNKQRLGLNAALIYVIIDSLRSSNITISKNDLEDYLSRDRRTVNRAIKKLLDRKLVSPDELEKIIKSEKLVIW